MWPVHAPVLIITVLHGFLLDKGVLRSYAWMVSIHCPYKSVILEVHQVGGNSSFNDYICEIGAGF